MAHPLNNGAAPSTAFGARGYHWSCRKDSSGRGIHTGADWPAPTGTPVYAVDAGDVRYRSYGGAFGLQLAVSPDGAGEWFYAHLSWRVPDGTRVKAGDLVGKIGSTGNSTGPHLHLEWHPHVKNRWDCSAHADPWSEIQRLGGSVEPSASQTRRAERTRKKWRFPKGHQIYAKYLTYGGHRQNADKTSDSIKALQEMLNRHPLKGGATIPVTGKYTGLTDAEVIKCQTQHGFGADAPGESFVGPEQLAHLISATDAPYAVVDDRPAGSSGGAPPPAKQGVRVVSFNWPSRYKSGSRSADRQLWSELSAQADVIGLQEAHWAYRNVLTGNHEGWELWNPTIGDGKPSAEVLAWRTDIFDTLATGSTMISPPTKVQAEAAGPTTHREKHVVWADLRHKPTGQVWNVGVVHFVPSKHLGGATQKLWEKQRDELVAWIGRQGPRCVVVGDFNCDTARKDTAPIKRVATIRSACSHGKRRIDWIVVKTAEGVTSTRGRALPHRGQSDHKPVAAAITATREAAKPRLRGIDISDYQADIDLGTVDADFVIVKATEGRTYVSPSFEKQYAAAKAAGRLLGIYHFAAVNEPEVEADFFLDTVGDRVGEAVLVLDWERAPLDDVDWCARWLQRVESRTGVRSMLYMSESVANGARWQAVGACPLWVAAYRTDDQSANYDMSKIGSAPVVNAAAWPNSWALWQWSANGRLDGYHGSLDVNTCTLSAEEWRDLASPSG